MSVPTGKVDCSISSAGPHAASDRFMLTPPSRQENWPAAVSTCRQHCTGLIRALGTNSLERLQEADHSVHQQPESAHLFKTYMERQATRRGLTRQDQVLPMEERQGHKALQPETGPT